MGLPHTCLAVLRSSPFHQCTSRFEARPVPHHTTITLHHGRLRLFTLLSTINRRRNARGRRPRQTHKGNPQKEVQEERDHPVLLRQTASVASSQEATRVAAT